MNNIRTHSEDPRRFLERKQYTSVTSVNGYDNLSDKLCSGMKRVKELPKNLFSILYTTSVPNSIKTYSLKNPTGIASLKMMIFLNTKQDLWNNTNSTNNNKLLLLLTKKLILLDKNILLFEILTRFHSLNTITIEMVI